MYISEIELRVRYAETDQMGYCYYGNYAQYFEVGRVEALRSLGLSYKELEKSGIGLPVLDFSIKYLKPALYDDKLTIRTIIKEMPLVKIGFEYETFNESGDLLNRANTNLAFIDLSTGKPIKAPLDFLTALERELK